MSRAAAAGLALLLAVPLALVGAGPASAAAVDYADNTGSPSRLAYGGGATQTQTFTALATGELTAVTLDLATTRTVTLSITDAAGYTASAYGAADNSGQVRRVLFTFADPAFVRQGAVYTLTATGYTAGAYLYVNGYTYRGGDSSFEANWDWTFGTRIDTREASVPVLAAQSFPQMPVGTDVDQTVAASGSPTVRTVAVTAGALPAGLTMASNGRVTGRASAAGDYAFTVTAANGMGSTSQAYNWSVRPAVLPGAPSLVGLSYLPGGFGYSFRPAVAVGDFPIESYTATATRLDTGAVSSCTSASPNCSITGLEIGVSYALAGFATSRAGNSAVSSSVTLSAVGTMAAPVLSSARQPDDTYLVSWTAPDPRGGTIHAYTLDARGTSAFVQPTNPSYNIGAIPLGESVAVSVRAHNQAGAGATATLTVTNHTAPSTPAAPAASSTDGRVAVSWTAPAANGQPLTGYELQERAAGGSWVTVVSGPAGATAYSAARRNGVGLEYRVRYSNSLGWSSFSAASATTTPVGPPSAPGAPAAEARPGAVALGWSTPDNGGSAITGFLPQYRLQGTSTWTDAAMTLANEATITGLVTASTYEFRVSAVNALGSTPSPTVVAMPYGDPSAPVLALAPRDSAVDIAWDVSYANGGGVVRYEYQTRQSALQEWSTTVTTMVPSATVPGTNGTPLFVRVRAATPVAASAWVEGYAIPRTVPSAPDAPDTTAGNSSVTLEWSAPADGGAAILSYDLRYRIVGDAAWTASDATTSAATIDGLLASTPYEFQVRALNVAGAGAWSTSAFATPWDLPSVPADLALEAGDELLVADWAASAPNGGGAVSYEVEYRSSPDTEWTAAATTAETTATIDGLSNGTGYTVRVRATTPVASSAWTEASAVPVTLPGTPADLAATGGDSAIELDWAAPTDTGGTAIAGYDVRYRLAGDSTWSERDSVTAPVVIGGLENSALYEIEVRAVSAVGPGDWLRATATPYVWAPVLTRADGTDVSGRPLAPGDVVTVSGTGGLPGNPVSVELHSTPVVLGSTLVGADGSYRLNLTIPAVGDGAHELVVVFGLDGSAQVSTAVTVATPLAATSAAATSARALASTGADGSPVAATALVLLLLGALLVVRRRRA
jgi:hypothetical protein